MREPPLSDITVVELCQNVAGPYAGLILAQLGARVIKVERPGEGDDTRAWGPPFWNNESAIFAVMNAGKESIALDLDDDADRASLRALTSAADVVLAAWRPGTLERRGFGYEDVVRDNPSVVYGSISGFGTAGPLAGQPGYDPLIQAFSGLMSVTGEPGGGPVRAGTSVMDMGTGMWTALGVLAALRHRSRSGEGTHVTGSLFETGLAWLPYQLVGYLATGESPHRMGSGLAMLVPYQAFPTADGWLVVAAGNDTLWRRLCEAIDRPDLGGDEDLATNPRRVANRDRVVAELTKTLQEGSTEEWQRTLKGAGVPCSPVQNVSEVAAHPQTAAVDMLTRVPHPDIEDFTLPGLPLNFDGWRPRPTGPPPGLGDFAGS
ncbi:MAG: CoA transferase [Nitriliruptorales bacterium]|nr:CoA transferase [Nitriliruptorales bacterium]